jgi:ATP-dependent protease HslVU (ClpYQ) peptidase subunit
VQVVLVADGQVTMGGTVVKPNVRKTRKIGEHVVGGFAGACSPPGRAMRGLNALKGLAAELMDA